MNIITKIIVSVEDSHSEELTDKLDGADFIGAIEEQLGLYLDDEEMKHTTITEE